GGWGGGHGGERGGARPGLPVETEELLRGPKHGQPKAAFVRERRRTADEFGQGARRPDGVAGDDEHAGPDSVGEEAGAVGCEEPLGIATELEERERVAAVALDDTAGPAVALF